MSEMQVVFVEQPVVGQRAHFLANGQRMSSSPVARVDTDLTRPGWFCVTTASGNTYSGPLKPGYQATAYATQYPPYTPSQPVSINLGPYAARPVPPEILVGLNWGAFFLTIFWSVAHNVWIGLLSLVPGLGWVVPFFLLFKGNEWAWQCRQFQSVAQFREVQRKWMIAGLIVWCAGLLMAIAYFALLVALFTSLQTLL